MFKHVRAGRLKYGHEPPQALRLTEFSHALQQEDENLLQYGRHVPNIAWGRFVPARDITITCISFHLHFTHRLSIVHVKHAFDNVDNSAIVTNSLSQKVYYINQPHPANCSPTMAHKAHTNFNHIEQTKQQSACRDWISCSACFSAL